MERRRWNVSFFSLRSSKPVKKSFQMSSQMSFISNCGGGSDGGGRVFLRRLLSFSRHRLYHFRLNHHRPHLLLPLLILLLASWRQTSAKWLGSCIHAGRPLLLHCQPEESRIFIKVSTFFLYIPYSPQTACRKWWVAHAAIGHPEN